MGAKKNSSSKPKGGGKSGGDGDNDKGGGKLKGGQKIEVRHILVRYDRPLISNARPKLILDYCVV